MKFLSRKSLIVLHDLFMTAAAIVAAFYLRFETPGLEERFNLLVWLVPGIVVYAGFVYSFFHLDDAKWRFASLPDRQQYFPCGHRDRGLAAGARLHPGRAESLRHVLLRQDHDRHLLDPPDVLPGRSAHRLSLFPLFAHAPACAQRRIRADPDSRPRRRRRGAAARDRKRRGEENLAGRHPVAVAVRSGTVDPRHSGARHVRRSRARGDRSRQCADAASPASC